MRVGEEFVHVANHARAVGIAGKNRAVMGEVEEVFEDGCGWSAACKVVEFFKDDVSALMAWKH